jgi:hypothetical protein|uniref:Uncharacterized protein n=1 Tax=Sipha flava TaxID=143950 RepID=A0A2S2QQ05_9HEMI
MMEKRKRFVKYTKIKFRRENKKEGLSFRFEPYRNTSIIIGIRTIRVILKSSRSHVIHYIAINWTRLLSFNVQNIISQLLYLQINYTYVFIVIYIYMTLP